MDDAYGYGQGKKAARKDMGGTSPGGEAAAKLATPLLKPSQTVRLADGGPSKGKSHGKSPRSKANRPPPRPMAPPMDVPPVGGLGAGPPPMLPPGGPPGMKTGGRVVRDGKTNRFKKGGAVDLLRLAAGGSAKLRRGVRNDAGKPIDGVGKQNTAAGKSQAPRVGPKTYDVI